MNYNFYYGLMIVFLRRPLIRILIRARVITWGFAEKIPPCTPPPRFIFEISICTHLK